MKLSEIQVGERYHVRSHAPTDHEWQDPIKEPYRQIMEKLLGSALESDKAELSEYARREMDSLGPEAAQVWQVVGEESKTRIALAGVYSLAEVVAIGVPYKKGCLGILMRANGVEFTVHYSALVSDAQLVEDWEERRAWAAEWIAKRPGSVLSQRLADYYGLVVSE